MSMEKNRRNQAFETAKTVVLAMLVASLAILLVIYIGGTHIYQSMTRTDEKKVFDKLWSVQSGQRSDGLDKSRLLPGMIGYRLTGTEPVCTVKDSESASELYEIISPCIIELFGNGSTCEELTYTDGELLYTEAVTGSEYIFMRWHEPVLYQLIYAYSAGRLTITESDTAVYRGKNPGGAYISELVIVPESDVAAHRFTAIAKDSDGRYFKFSRDPGALASDFHISKLSDAAAKVETLPLEFTTNDIMRLEPLVLSELQCADIEKLPAAMPEDQKSDRLLTLFGYNPDKLKSYHYDGGAVYYDSHSRIRLEPGRISYQEVELNSGIGLSKLLGYSVDGEFSLFDKLAAVDYLLTGLSGINSGLVGGEAKLCLGNVYTDGGLLVFEYFYTCENIRITGEPAVKAVFGQETLHSFELDAANFRTTGESLLLPTPGYIIRKLGANSSLEGVSSAKLRLVYVDGRAEWQITNG